jgi:outer membrane cobalamin receptor
MSGDTISVDIALEYEVAEIDQVVVSASRIEQKISELTVSLSLIKPEALSGGHITDAQELMNKTSGVEVLDGQASIRGGSGFSYGAGSRVLALIDGLPVMSADAGNIRWQFLPLDNISQVEIIKGARQLLTAHQH